jgi:hypothetical protein
VANVWKTSGDSDAEDEQPAVLPLPAMGELDPAEDEESDDLELGDPRIDEADLPELDLEDAEALGQDHEYEDLLDRRWLEQGGDEDDNEDDRSPIEEVGLTIDLDDLSVEEEGAQIVDLDVGSLLTPLSSDELELELDPGPEQDRGSFALGALREMLLPEREGAGLDDHDVGDDDSFPAFDDSSAHLFSDRISSEIPPRPEHDEPDAESGPDELA